jgi:Ulp1 family protease
MIPNFEANKLLIFDTYLFPQLVKQGCDGLAHRKCAVDMFEMDFLVLPIHHSEEKHWSLVVVANPGGLFASHE